MECSESGHRSDLRLDALDVAASDPVGGRTHDLMYVCSPQALGPRQWLLKKIQ